MTEDRFESINVGDEAELLHTISASDLDLFVQLTGDNNPLHVDDSYAATTSFKKTVVHGMLTASFISTIIGTKLPGKGSLWYEQQLRFLAPVRVGEDIRVLAKVRHKSIALRILTISIVVFGRQGKEVIEGEVKVKVLKPEVREKTDKDEKNMGVVIVTGASRGIGAAIAKELALTGYTVLVNYSKSAAPAEEVVRDIRGSQGQAIAFQADVSNDAEVREMVAFTLKEFGSITGIVNNASPKIENVNFQKLRWNDIQIHLDVQIKGSFNLCQAVLPHFIENKNGVIVNIASTVADNIPPVELLPYSMAKAALISFSRSLAVEYGPKMIRVNCVSPGMTQTDLIADIPEKAKMVVKMQTPLRRLASAEDIAGVVGFLFSEKALHITGENIRVCGGLIMR